MKTLPMRFTFLLLFLSLGFAACSREADKPSEPEALLDQTMTTFVENLQVSLDEAGEELTALETRLEEAGDEAPQALRDGMDGVQAEFEKLRLDLQRLASTSASIAENQREVLASRFYRLDAELETLVLQSFDTREELEAAVSSRLDWISGQLSELDRQIRLAEGDVRLTYAEALEELQTEYRLIRQEFDDLKVADAGRFEAMRDEMAEAIAQLKAEIHEISDQLAQLLESPAIEPPSVEASL
jgi:predicted transcriptional regulator